MKKMWMGSLENGCDICGHPFGRFFFDAKTKVGTWALLCERCWGVYTDKRLGLGIGQKYETSTKMMVEG